MARYKELREMTADELVAQLAERKKALFNLRLRHASKELQNTAELRRERRDVAIVATLLREKQAAAGGADKS